MTKKNPGTNYAGTLFCVSFATKVVYLIQLPKFSAFFLVILGKTF